jgi:hypothetical protein
MTDLTLLIPELAEWNNGKGIDIDSWISCIGRFDQAIGYGKVFWPDFAIHDDCVLFAPVSVAAFDDWVRHTGGSKRSVEATMNHRHILDLFQGGRENVTRAAILHLGRLLKDMWACKLRRDFPGRHIMVDFSEEYTEDLVDYQITIYHEHTEA